MRHGESTWNAERRWQGQADPPLSSLGTRQAETAARRLGDAVGVGATVWSSDLRRAVETAEALAGGIGAPAPRLDAALRERAAGEWTGLDRDEIEAGWPGWLDARRSPAGFEPDAELLARVLDVLDRIAREASAPPTADGGGPDGGGAVDAEAVVVTHGGVIRTVERHLGASPEPVPNLGGRALTRDPGSAWTLGARLVLLDPGEVEVTVPPPR